MRVSIAKKKLRPTQIREKQMKKHLMYSLLAIVTIGLTGCSAGYYVSNSQNVNLSQTQVVLSQANFRVVKQLSVTYVYTNKHTMKFDANQMKESAYAALVKKAKLTGAQTIINVTMEQIQRKSENFWTILFAPKYEQAIVVSGTVIEFLPEGVKPSHSSVVESSVVYEDHSGNLSENPEENHSDVENNKIQKSKEASAPSANYKANYEAVKEIYAKTNLNFFKIYESVRQFMLSNHQEGDLARVDNFLLTGDLVYIKALKSEVLHSKSVEKQAQIFIKYSRF